MIVKEKNGEGFLDLRICDNLELMAEIKDKTIDLNYIDKQYFLYQYMFNKIKNLGIKHQIIKT